MNTQTLKIETIDITPNNVFRAKKPSENFQKWQDGFKQEFKFCQISSIKKYYSSLENKTVSFVFYFPFNGCLNNNTGNYTNKGLCSCEKLTDFKRKFKKLVFDK